MALVILMCGPAGSGKSTIARRLERAGMLRLSVDEIAWRQGHRVHPIPEPAQAVVHSEIRERLSTAVAGEAEGLNADVVVDSSFWSRASRDAYRALLTPLGIVPVVCYVATPREEVLRRVAARDNAGPDRIVLTAERAASYVDSFEVPTPGEGPLVVVGGG